jgi:CHAT domain-containing protein
MVLRRVFTLLIGSFLLLTNCAEPVAKQEQRAVSRGVYATKDSIDVSRYDLAKSYINETTRVVPPPDAKDRVKIPSFTTPGTKATKGQPGTESQRYVVLPPNEQNTHVIVMNSPEYNQLLTNYSSLQESERTAWETVDKVRKADDKVIKAVNDELAKLRARPNIFVRAWNFIHGLFKWGFLGFAVLGIAAFVVALLVPGLAPFIWAAFRMVGSVIGAMLGLLTKLILWIVGLFKKK